MLWTMLFLLSKGIWIFLQVQNLLLKQEPFCYEISKHHWHQWNQLQGKFLGQANQFYKSKYGKSNYLQQMHWSLCLLKCQRTSIHKPVSLEQHSFHPLSNQYEVEQSLIPNQMFLGRLKYHQVSKSILQLYLVLHEFRILRFIHLGLSLNLESSTYYSFKTSLTRPLKWYQNFQHSQKTDFLLLLQQLNSDHQDSNQ